MKRISSIYRLVRYLGLGWLWQRFLYLMQLRLGIVEKKTPARAWDDYPLTSFLKDQTLAEPQAYQGYRLRNAPKFFFSADQRPAYQALLETWRSGPLSVETVVEELAQGNFLYFNHTYLPVGLPPDWRRNAITGQIVPGETHWSRIDDFGFGDIKVIWEPNRFAFVYHLVRAYWRTGDERWAELFWSLVEDWRRNNPPNQGPNWKCGQEISFRVMAWLFGLYGFADAAATTPERVSALAQMVAVSAQRIEANIDYALSQRNNHGISEGVGLWTVGLLFPEFWQSSQWREKGRQILESLGKTLIYEDGAFVQHSVNYHRLMLHDYIWALRLGGINHNSFSDSLKERISQAETFLFQLLDTSSGQVPYYGQNDGALILPLNNCDYLDFRPVIQAAHYLVHQKRRFESGLWDEDLLWLFGPEALESTVEKEQRTYFHAPTGGYYTLRSQQSWLFVRCATFQHRPGQADMLHVDLWWRGCNMALDAGTYSYNAPEPWDNPLAHTFYHNTVTVDRRDQMDRVGKFLWLPWLQSEVRFAGHAPDNAMYYWEGQHNGYQRLPDPVSHVRGILQLPGETWLVIDHLGGSIPHDFRLHWLFPDFPYEWSPETGHLQIQTPQGAFHVFVQTTLSHPTWSLIHADPDTPRGWQAPYYLVRRPALSLSLSGRGAKVAFFTLFSPVPATLQHNDQFFEIIQPKGYTLLYLSETEAAPMLKEIRLQGAVNHIWNLY